MDTVSYVQLCKPDPAYTITDFPRKEGIGATNKTCFNRYQRRYGTQRDNYAPIMFTYEASGHQIRVFNAGDLYWHKRLVIDYWLGRVSNRRELPLVLSDQFEGEFMEPALRIHPHINYRTIRARMCVPSASSFVTAMLICFHRPPFIKTRKEGKYREVWNPNALSNRTERFRDRMGAISWARGGVDPKKKRFLDSHVSQEARVGNDTKGCRDLTKAEMEDLDAYLKNK